MGRFKKKILKDNHRVIQIKELLRDIHDNQGVSPRHHHNSASHLSVERMFHKHLASRSSVFT